MHIMIIDNKRSELANGNKAIVEAGHTISNKDAQEYVPVVHGDIKDHNKDLVDNLHKYPDWNLRLIRSAIRSLKRRALKKGEKFGVITDLFFKLTPHQPENSPSGLLIALLAQKYGVPCVICTDCNKGDKNHHTSDAAWLYDGFVMYGLNEDIFEWEENKNWAAAVAKLEKLADDQ